MQFVSCHLGLPDGNCISIFIIRTGGLVIFAV